ncbi:MAG TPA: hypothetical protein VFA26_17380, partial [Gemmataceae bacterium]|nr:hypothetical protein [Gemmataceae bacterium]
SAARFGPCCCTPWPRQREVGKRAEVELRGGRADRLYRLERGFGWNERRGLSEDGLAVGESFDTLVLVVKTVASVSDGVSDFSSTRLVDYAADFPQRHTVQEDVRRAVAGDPAPLGRI